MGRSRLRQSPALPIPQQSLLWTEFVRMAVMEDAEKWAVDWQQMAPLARRSMGPCERQNPRCSRRWGWMVGESAGLEGETGASLRRWIPPKLAQRRAGSHDALALIGPSGRLLHCGDSCIPIFSPLFLLNPIHPNPLSNDRLTRRPRACLLVAAATTHGMESRPSNPHHQTPQWLVAAPTAASRPSPSRALSRRGSGVEKCPKSEF